MQTVKWSVLAPIGTNTIISDEPHVVLGGNSHNVGARADGSANTVEGAEHRLCPDAGDVWQWTTARGMRPTGFDQIGVAAAQPSSLGVDTRPGGSAAARSNVLGHARQAGVRQVGMADEHNGDRGRAEQC